MERNTEQFKMLDLMLRPAFYVQEGLIRHVNPAAQRLLLTVDTPIAPLLASGQEEYTQFTDCMQLQLQIGGQLLDATVIRRDQGEIFLPDSTSSQEQFRVLSLASMQLREPLAGLTTITEQLFADATSMAAAQANRRLHQMLRIMSNMSDAQRFSQPECCRMEYTEIRGFLQEILDKADTLLENIGIRIHAKFPQEEIYVPLDREQMERSLYNLLSNAAKYSAPGSPICVELREKNHRLHLSVTSQAIGGASRNFYDHLLREPGLEDPNHGLGLGLLLVRSTAANHGGAVLIDQPAPNHTRVTMTLQIRHNDSFQVKSPVIYLDYTGERDHGLFELADVLPAELYYNDKA